MKGGFGGYGAPAKRPVKRSSKGHRGGYGSRSFSSGKGSIGGFKGVQGGFSKGGYGAPSKGGYGQSLKGGYGQSRKSGYGQARKEAGFGGSRKGFSGYGAPQKGGYQDIGSYNASASYTAFDDHDDVGFGIDRFGGKGDPSALFSSGDAFGTQSLFDAPVGNEYDFSLDNVQHDAPDFSGFGKESGYSFSLDDHPGYGKSPYGNQGGFSLDKIGYSVGGKGKNFK